MKLKFKLLLNIACTIVHRVNIMVDKGLGIFDLENRVKRP